MTTTGSAYQTIPDPTPPPPPLRVGLVYDMDACRGPTGVTRHALAMLERLGRRGDVRLTAVSGRIHEPDGLARWDRLGEEGVRRRELPIGTRTLLRLWRVAPWPPLEAWTGRLDWAYCPAELFVPAGRARRAVTSHDVRQDLTLGGPRRRAALDRAFGRADLVLSVSRYNTEQLLNAYPALADRAAIVPNAADDLFFEPPTDRERRSVRAELGLAEGVPYLLSVANFQPRKNLPSLVRAAGRLAEVASGDLAIVLIGEGSDDEARRVHEAATSIGPRAVVRFAGYRQGPALRAAYAEAAALVFPSTCESFGIPAVEAMAVGCPVVLADSTALPEVGGEAGWYAPPADEEALASAIRGVLDRPEERARKVEIGRRVAAGFRWDSAADRLVEALRGRS
jgi:glycosyltransferase involved in cell wall biosynthesis